MGCTCLFLMIQSAAGSKFHPLFSWQLCLARVIHQDRQSAADRQTSRFGPPHKAASNFANPTGAISHEISVCFALRARQLSDNCRHVWFADNYQIGPHEPLPSPPPGPPTPSRHAICYRLVRLAPRALFTGQLNQINADENQEKTAQ